MMGAGNWWVSLPTEKDLCRNITHFQMGAWLASPVAKWLTPNGRTIDKVGLTPDQVVPMTQADFTAGLDPQLDAAIQLLLHPINITDFIRYQLSW